VGRFLDLRPDDEGLPAELVLSVGDVVRVTATGGSVRSGSGVELLGILTDAVVGLDGSVLSPAGPPGVVLLRAREPGRALVDLVSGDPFRQPLSRTLAVRVEP
jgi:protein involved in polysaccharide export with SLBB domain